MKKKVVCVARLADPSETEKKVFQKFTNPKVKKYQNLFRFVILPHQVNNMIIEQFQVEGHSEDHIVQPPSESQKRLLSALISHM